MERFELRQQDYSLSPEQDEVRTTFADLFARYCATDVVRAAEPLGYDAGLWKRVAAVGAASMGLPEPCGDGATLPDLTVVAEEHGRVLAPVPFVEHCVGGRLLAAYRTALPAGFMESIALGEAVVSLALDAVTSADSQLVPAGAVADAVVALRGGQLVLVQPVQRFPHVPNQGSAPLAWWRFGSDQRATVLDVGTEAVAAHARAVSEWKLLTAASLVGATRESLTLAVEFVTTRHTMGVPVGSLQGVSFPLADVAIDVAGAGNLVRRAAWMCEHEPGVRPDLTPAAFAYAAEVAARGITACAHFHGGLGLTFEADISLYFLRCKTLALQGGDPTQNALAVGDMVVRGAEDRSREQSLQASSH